MGKHWQECNFQKYFSRSPNGRDTELYCFLVAKNKWLDGLVSVETQNQKRNLYTEEMEKDLRELEQEFHREFFQPIQEVPLPDNIKPFYAFPLTLEGKNITISYLTNAWARHPDNLQEFLKHLPKIKEELLEDGYEVRDIKGNPQYNFTLGAHKNFKIFFEPFIFKLKIFTPTNPTKSLGCIDTTFMAVRRKNNAYPHIIMPISYDRMIVGFHPNDGMQIDELTIDTVNHLLTKSFSEKILCDSKMPLTSGNIKIINKYSVYDFWSFLKRLNHV